MKNLFDIERFPNIKTFLINDIVALFVIFGYVCFTHIAFLQISPLSCGMGRVASDFRLGLLEEVGLFPLYVVVYLLFLLAAKSFFMRRKMYAVLRIIVICSIILTGLAAWLFAVSFKYEWSLLGIFIVLFELVVNMFLFVGGCSVALKYLKQIKEQAEMEMIPMRKCDERFAVIGFVVLLLAWNYNLLSGEKVCCQFGGADNCKDGYVEHLRWGVLHGKKVRYDYEGNIKSIVEYKDGCPDGVAIDYYDYKRGSISDIDNFKSCKAHGERVHYDIGGAKKCAFYIEGREVSEEVWFEYKKTHGDEYGGTNECDQKVVKSLKNGELQKSEYVKGRLHGVSKLFYDERGKYIKRVENYQNGQLLGEQVFYDERGMIYKCKFYIEGREVNEEEWAIYKQNHQNEDLGTNECDV